MEKNINFFFFHQKFTNHSKVFAESIKSFWTIMCNETPDRAGCDVLWVKVPAPLKLLNRCILQ